MNSHVHDLIGIGFGPSNIALAIALEERRDGGGAPVDALFIERQADFGWHRHMLLPGTHMQISFLKDLATLRNPASRFTFLAYLHERRRLQDFINLKSFFPSRHEFNDYLAWAAAQFEDRVAYGEEVLEVLPIPSSVGDGVALLRVRSRCHGGAAEGKVVERLTRHLVVGIGGEAHIPDCLRALSQDRRIFHANSYLREIGRCDGARRIAIVGAGQSAAEIFMDMQGRPGPAGRRIDLISRARALRPSDDSPFVNEIFNADFTDRMYARPAKERAALLDEFWQTNYAAPDRDLVERIFRVFYEQSITGATEHRLLRHHELVDARLDAQTVSLTLLDHETGLRSEVAYDAVILATGYVRDRHLRLLSALSPHLDSCDGFAVDRDYQLRLRPTCQPMVFLQGACEDSHGLSDTLLSVTAVRTGEIAGTLLRRLLPLQQAAQAA